MECLSSTYAHYIELLSFLGSDRLYANGTDISSIPFALRGIDRLALKIQIRLEMSKFPYHTILKSHLGSHPVVDSTEEPQLPYLDSTRDDESAQAPCTKHRSPHNIQRRRQTEQ